MSGSLLSSAAARLEGKVALITGGASGIGEVTSRLFCRHGAKVVIADIQDDKGHAVCRGINGAASYVHCDVTDESHVTNAVDTAVSKHGKLDIMFNNAGISETRYTPIFEYDRAEFDTIMAINVTGVFLGIKHAARVMVPARRGSIISTASITSLVAGLAPHAYTCSKQAVVGITKNAAVELGQVGIRVNCVSPHIVATPLACKGFGMSEEELEEFTEAHGVLKGVRFKAQDIAEAVLYLGSDESKYVSGHNLAVDGAFSKVNASIPTYKY